MPRWFRSSTGLRPLRFRALFVFTATVALFSASIFLLRAADGPEPPSQKTLAFENLILRMRFPDNWKATGQGSSYNIAPDDGMVFDTKGGSSVAYGVVMNL